MESQLKDLENELAEYDQLKGSGSTHIRGGFGSIAELGSGLVRARIAAGLSQKELAARLHLKERRKLSVYEQTEYETASLARLADVARALHVRINRLTIEATEKSSRR